MRALDGRGLWAGVRMVSCLLLVACSSQESPGGSGGSSGTSGTGGFDGGSPGAGGQTDDGDASSAGRNCAIIEYTLTHGPAPDSCTFSLPVVPADPRVVRVMYGNAIIPPNDTEGWSYVPGFTAITLAGTYCQAVLDGTITTLRFLVGCTGVPIP